jgi:hypothetical protein
MNRASKCQASGVTFSGTGMPNQIKRPMPMAIADGTSLGKDELFIALTFQGFGLLTKPNLKGRYQGFP